MRFLAFLIMLPVLAVAQGRGTGARVPGGGQTNPGATPSGSSQSSGRAAGQEAGPAVFSGQAAAQASRPEDLGSVEGAVFNAATGEPLGKAELTLRRTDMGPGMGAVPSSYSGSADSSGRFLIPRVEPGRYRLTARRNGFVAAEFGAADPSRPGSPITVERAQKLTAVNLRLSPHGVITGRIVDSDGDPMAGVQVQAYRYQYVQGRRQLSPQAGASSNDLGEYRIYGLPPAKYYLSATYRSSAPTGGAGGAGRGMLNGMGPGGQPDATESWAPTYYPGAYDPSSASTLDVTAGAELRNINLTLTKVRTYRLRGQVTSDPASGGGRGISVTLTSRNGLARDVGRSARVDQQGAFEIRNVLPGAYTLTAASMGGGRSPLYARRQVNVGSSDMDGVNLAIPAAVDVSGSIAAEDAGTPPTLTSVQIRLQPRESDETGPRGGPGGMPGGFGGAGAAARVAEGGAFKIAGICPDSYTLSVSNLPEGYYVASIRVGSAEALTSGLEVSAGTPAIRIVLRPNAGQVSGLVLNPETMKAAVSATVVLVPQEPERSALSSFYRTGSTDQYGQFTIKSIPPGEYKLYAWDVVSAGAYMDPEFMRPYDTRGQAVTVRESSQQNVQLTLIPGDAVGADSSR